MKRILHLASISVATFTSLLSATSAAGEWYWAPHSSVDGGYETNPRYLDQAAREEWSTNANVGVDVRGGTERARLNLTSGARFATYESDRNLDTNDQQLAISSSWAGEKVSWTGSANLLRDTTNTSELGTTGLVQDNRRRKQWSVSAGPSWVVSETSSAGASARYSDTRYADAADLGLQDYTTTGASAYVSSRWSERTQWTLTVSGNQVDREILETRSRSASATVSVSQQFSPRWSWTLSAGPTWSEAAESTRRITALSGSLIRSGEKLQLSASASRQVEPVGTGSLTQSEALILNADGALTERLSWSLSGQLSRNRQLFEEFAFFNRETSYYGASATLSWRLSESWSLRLNTNARTQKLENGIFLSQQADNARVAVGVAWSGRTRTL